MFHANILLRHDSIALNVLLLYVIFLQLGPWAFAMAIWLGLPHLHTRRAASYRVGRMGGFLARTSH